MNLLRFVAVDVPNIQATFIQAVGLWMFGLLLVILARAVGRDWFTEFAKSFIFLAAAVTSLRVAFSLGPRFGRAFFFSYYMGEYLFLAFLVLGMKRLAGGSPRAINAPFLFAAATLAALLSMRPEFSQAFVVQAGILATGLFTAFLFALRKPVQTLPGFGLHLLRFSLLVLAVGFAQYVPVLGMAVLENRSLPVIYATFMPVFDLLFEATLAFAMIVTGMESVQRELLSANENLERATSRLDVLARTDPLTGLLNRYAFAAVLEAPREGASFGSVVVIDLDGLKALNDTYGHSAGDQAIRAFAGALRARLRADDLIFRWGGDEFLAVLFGLPHEETAERLAQVGAVETAVEGASAPITIRASYGVAPFESLGHLRAAAEAADTSMYEAKRGRGSARP